MLRCPLRQRLCRELVLVAKHYPDHNIRRWLGQRVLASFGSTMWQTNLRHCFIIQSFSADYSAALEIHLVCVRCTKAHSDMKQRLCQNNSHMSLPGPF